MLAADGAPRHPSLAHNLSFPALRAACGGLLEAFSYSQVHSMCNGKVEISRFISYGTRQ